MPYRFPTAAAKVRRNERRLIAARAAGWNESEIERRLDALIGGADAFPSYSAFIAAGQRRLWDHVQLRGGGPTWAARLGVRYPQGGRTSCLLWTKERVRDELAMFLADREEWPSMAEFRACGREGLRRAVIPVRRHVLLGRSVRRAARELPGPAPHLD